VGRLRLIVRLVLRDLPYRPAQAFLVLIVIAAATTTLSLGLALTGATSHPYAQTRAATRGSDVVASQNMIVALAAAALGLGLGWLCAPLLTGPSSGLIGTAGAPSVTDT
jgi:hypothetical protein